MKLFNLLFGSRATPTRSAPPLRRSSLQVETLEAREVLTARPLPVLMVLADHNDYLMNQSHVSIVPDLAAPGRSPQASAIVFVGGWGASGY